MLNPRAIAAELSQQYPGLIDAGFSSIVKTHTSPEVSEEIKKRNMTHKFLSKDDLVDHQYLLVIDGKTWSRTNKIALASSSVSIKQESPWLEFFEKHPDYKDGVHYMSVHRNLSNLVDVLRHLKSNPTLARHIAKNGEDFARKHLNRAQVLSYANSVIDYTASALLCPE